MQNQTSQINIVHFNAIEQQIRPWHVAHSALINILRKYPRHQFLKGQTDEAYIDQNLKLNEAKLFAALGLKHETPSHLNRAAYTLAPKLEARLLQIIIECLESQIKDLYEDYKNCQDQYAEDSIQKEQNHILKIVMLGADTGYIPHILNSLIESQYYHDELNIDPHFKVHLKITIIEPSANLLTLLSANLQEHHAQYLSSFKIMQNSQMHQISMNEDLQQTNIIFATASSPYILPLYEQALAENAYGIAFIGDQLLQTCDIYQRQDSQGEQPLELKKQKTVFETWLPPFDVPTPKVFVF